MVELDPVAIGFIVLLLAFVLFVYFFLRRTALAFREGQDRGRDR